MCTKYCISVRHLQQIFAASHTLVYTLYLIGTYQDSDLQINCFLKRLQANMRKKVYQNISLIGEVS